jgi:hypothetical protein
MKTPISWMSHVGAYLALRRGLGFKLTIDEAQLRSFARFADKISTADHLTVALAVAWARSSRRQTHSLGRAAWRFCMVSLASACVSIRPPKFRHTVSSALLTGG